MPTTVESLQIEVQSNSNTAVNGIDALASTLEKLRNATKGGAGLASVSKQLTSLNTALNKVSGTNVETLNRLAQAVRTLSSASGTKLSPTLATQISKIGSAVQSLNGVNFSPLSSLANSLMPLSNIGKSNLNSFISQLQRLPKAVQALNGSNIAGLSSSVRELVSALTPLTQMGKNNLTSFITQLSKIPKLMESLRSVNIGTLTTQTQQLANAFAPLASQMQSIASGFAAFPSRIQNLIRTTNNLSSANMRASNSYVNLASRIALAVVSIRGIARIIAGFVTEANAYIENLNLFSVSMGDYTQQAKEYAETLSEGLGIDTSEWMRNQGVFMTITQGFGVASDKAYLMSKNLTQLGYDLSSLFNEPVDTAMQKLQSGIAGELEPLRRWGYDLSIARLEQERLNLGIEKSVSSMTQAEKSQLRYYAIMTQVTQAQGDLQRSINAPANQLRILQAQVTMAARALGNVFLPVLQAILPYAIAAAKVIRMVADAIASLFGFRLSDFTADLSNVNTSVGGIASGADDVASGLGDAGKKAKALKNALLGIDELNVISPNENTGGSGGGAGGVGGVGGGDLGIPLPEYEFFNGELNKQIDEIVQKMKELLPWVVGIGTAFAAWKVGKGIVNFIDKLMNFKGMGSAFGPLGILTFMADLTEFVKYLEDFMKNGATFQNVAGMISEFVGMVGDALIILGSFKLGGALKAIQGIGEIFIAIRDISENGINWGNATTAIRGLTNIGIAIGLFMGGTKGLKFAAWSVTIQGFTSVISELAENWEAIKKGDWSGVDKVVLVIGIVEALGGLMTALGVFSKLGGGKFGKNKNANIPTIPVTALSTNVQGANRLSSLVPSPKTVLKGLADVALIIGGLVGIIEAVGLLTQIPGFEQALNSGISSVGAVFKGLWEIMLPLATLSAGILMLGKTGGIKTVATGFADLAIVMGGTSILLTAIGALLSIPSFSDFLATGVSSVVSVFKGLEEVAIPIGTLSAVLVALGIATPAVILSGFTGFALVIGGLEVLLVALGALNQIPGFSWIVGEGGKVLIQLGEILGGFAGSIVNSFLVKVSDSFPEIGQNLADFITNAQPFFTGIEAIKPESVDAVTKLANMILILTAADVLDGLTSWLTGGSSFSEFGKELSEFAPSLVEYSNAISGLDSGDLSAIQASADAVLTLAEMASKIPKTGGLAQVFTGITDIEAFGEQLVSFGDSIARYGENVSGLDTEVITASAAAADTLVELANDLPSIEGVAQFFTGSKDLGVFGEQLTKFGAGMFSYYIQVKTIKPDVVTASAAAAGALVELANDLPSMRGVAQFFSGNQDLGLFGDQLVLFGRGMRAYYVQIADIEPDVITASASVASSLVELANQLPKMRGVAQFFTGEQDIGLFGDQLVLFGRGMKAYYEYVKGIEQPVVTASTFAAQALIELAKLVPEKGGIFSLFTGDNSLAGFANDLVLFGERFKAYYDIISGITVATVSSVSKEINSILNWAIRVSETDTRGIASFGDEIRNLGEDFAACAEGIVNGFADRISSAYSSSMGSILSWATSIKEWFSGDSHGAINERTFSTYGDDIINGFKEQVNSTYSATKSPITTWATNIKNWFNNSTYGGVNKQTFGKYANEIVMGFRDRINSDNGQSQGAILTWANNIKTWFTNSGYGAINRQTFSQYGSEVISGFTERIRSGGSDLLSAITTLAANIKMWFTNNLYGGINSETFGKFAKTTIDGFKDGLNKNKAASQTSVVNWAKDIKKRFTSDTSGCGSINYDTFKEYAKDVIRGFNNGINGFYTNSRSYVRTWARDIKKTFTTELDEHSPSREFFQFGVFAVQGFNNAISTMGASTKPVVESWANSFMSVTPQMVLGVDTSAMKYYTSKSFSRSISANVTSNSNVTAVGFKEAMSEFYSEYLEPVVTQMAEDVRRQADKPEQTVVKVGNRTITDAVTTQERANGYRFVTR